MRAVNLIPADQRRASGAAGKSGGGVYFLLGGLAVIVACFAALTLTNKQVADKQATADRLAAQAQDAQAKAGGLASYKAFNGLVKQRSAAVQGLAATRFDWGATFAQVSRVIPSDVSLMQMAASTAPGTATAGVALRTSLSNPAVELVGCAPSQARVALLMSRLRRLEGVERVSISGSAKSDDAAQNAQASSESSQAGSCQIDEQTPQFQIVAFFGTPQAAGTTASSPAGTVKAAIDTINGGTAGTTTTPAPATPGS